MSAAKNDTGIILESVYRLHHVTGQDGELMTYDLLAERPPEANISHSLLPSREQHREFYHSNPYRAWLAIIPTQPTRQAERTQQRPTAYIRQGKTTPVWPAVGTVLLTFRNEIGIAILRDHRRQGYARRAIEEVLRIYPPLNAEPSIRPGHYVANVAPTNAPSIALFSSLGRLVQHTYRLDAPEEKA